MKVIEISGVDHLGDWPLEEGEKLWITCPDESLVGAEVILHEGKAHFTIRWHGIELDAPLEGLEAERR